MKRPMENIELYCSANSLISENLSARVIKQRLEEIFKIKIKSNSLIKIANEVFPNKTFKNKKSAQKYIQATIKSEDTKAWRNKNPQGAVTTKRRKGIDFYRTPEWRTVRYKAIIKYGVKCQCCGRSPKEHNIAIHVDHIKPRSKHPELELDINNLQILCEDCNLGKMARDETDWRP